MREQLTARVSLALLLAGASIVPVCLRAAEVPDSPEATELLSDARAQAFQLQQDAETMESFTRSSLSWQSHADAVARIKDHINTVGRQLVKLEAVRENASPWQRTAIDRIRPILKELASNTESIIDYLTKHPERLKLPAYQDYLEANADHSEDLAALISDFVKYGRNKGRMEHLKDKLEIPSE